MSELKFTPDFKHELAVRLKYVSVNFDRSDTFVFGVSSNLSQQKSPTAEIIFFSE